MPNRFEWWTNQVHVTENLDLLDLLPLFDPCSRDHLISLSRKGDVNHARSMQNLIQKVSSLSKPTTIGSSIKYLDEKTVTVNRGKYVSITQQPLVAQWSPTINKVPITIDG